jgi:hypothetical protein
MQLEGDPSLRLAQDDGYLRTNPLDVRCPATHTGRAAKQHPRLEVGCWALNAGGWKSSPHGRRFSQPIHDRNAQAHFGHGLCHDEIETGFVKPPHFGEQGRRRFP